MDKKSMQFCLENGPKWLNSTKNERKYNKELVKELHFPQN